MQGELITRALSQYQTPLYLFDETQLDATISHIRAVLPKDVLLCYAMKANSFVLPFVVGAVDRVEVCSPGEMRICQRAEVDFERIVVSGVHKDEGLMRELMESGAPVCRYTVESVLQYELLERLARELGIRVPMLIRLTSGNQFGIGANDVRMLVRRAQLSDAVEFCGIQYFSGTQNTSEKRLRREINRLDAFLQSLSDEMGQEVPELEFGAGLPIEYFAQDESTARQTEDAQLAVLGDVLANMRFDGRLAIELGRAIAASCGTYATRIVDTKRNSGRNYAIVDGGIHQIAYYGHAMLTQQPPCWLLSEEGGSCTEGAAQEPWSVFGSLCTGNDVLVKQLACAGMRVGDVLVFEKAGAYCVTEGISLFLSRDLPRVIMVDRTGRMVQVRDRIETYALNWWADGKEW